MLYEYAVEPKAIGESWENFTSLISLFGFERGRLISRFPKTWERQVIETAQATGMKEVKLQSLKNRLRKAKTGALIRTGRHYDPATGDWLDNAIRQHAFDPFRAIIASENPGNKDFILLVDETGEINDDTSLMKASSTVEVPRTGEALAGAMSLLLKSAKEMLVIDRYFNLENELYKETLREFFSVISKRQLTDVSCEIHCHDHKERPSINYVGSKSANWLADIMPEGMSLKLFVWQEKNESSDFHARFLLTDLGGINVEAGFSADGSHQKVLLTLLNPDLCREKLAMFRRDSTDYKLIEPVLEVSSDGHVSEI